MYDVYAASLENLRAAEIPGSTRDQALIRGAQALRILGIIDDSRAHVLMGPASGGGWYVRESEVDFQAEPAHIGESLTDALGQLAQTHALENEERDTIPCPPPAADAVDA